MGKTGQIFVWLVGVLLLAGCQSIDATPEHNQKDAAAGKQQTGTLSNDQSLVKKLEIDVPSVWGGEVFCAATECFLIAVEHDKSNVVLHAFERKKKATPVLLDRKKVAYHPDSAKWLSPNTVVAAVEASHSLDFFQVQERKLHPAGQVGLNFPPRDVVVVGQSENTVLMATSYRGQEVAWVEFQGNDFANAKVSYTSLCATPWHPLSVSRAPGNPNGGVAVACLDSKDVVFLDKKDLKAPPKVLFKTPKNKPSFPVNVASSPSGKWLYVALGTERENIRINMDTGEAQWLSSPLLRSTSVLALDEETLLWGDDVILLLQKINSDGVVQEERMLNTNGFSGFLQQYDVDGDGVDDVVVYNIAVLRGKMGVEVFYGPLWNVAQPFNPEYKSIK